MKRFALALLIGLGTLVGGAHAQTTVYVNDFEADANGFSTAGRVGLPTTPNAASPLSTMLGKFAGNEFTVLSLSGLTPGETYSLAFDLFIGGSWDGNPQPFGADCWYLRETISGQDLVNTTFSNIPGSDQSYTDGNPVGGAWYPYQSGADVLSADTDLFRGYSLYRFGSGAGNPLLTFTAGADGLASLTFQGLGLQSVEDEYWAIDNVRVTGTRDPNNIPEPGALALLGLAALPALARLRRGIR